MAMTTQNTFGRQPAGKERPKKDAQKAKAERRKPRKPIGSVADLIAMGGSQHPRLL
jgi:hypothetical protein